MKIIDALWEKRNLGITCKEIFIEESDITANVEQELSSIEAQYMVVKVPSGRYDVMRLMEKLGYSFIEGNINIVHNLKNIKLSGIQKRLSDSVSYSLMDNSDIEYMYEQIKKGIFTTDRIYLDPHFNKEQAAQRYIFWIQYELARGAQAYKVVYKNESVGFFTFKETKEGICYPFLIGLYKKYQQSALGNIIVYQNILESVKRGGKMISSYVSTNNLAVFKINISLGYFVKDICYVYVKHN